MKRTGMPDRSAPMGRGKPMTRTPLADTAQPPKRAVPLRRGESLRRTRITVTVPAGKRRAARNTGPTAKVRLLVKARCGGWCEWPGCPNTRTEDHHRLGRKSGGRGGAMATQLNGAAWLLATCGRHHRLVTSQWGLALELARSSGWLLIEGQDARQVPVLTRHAPAPILLDDAGDWTVAA